MRDPKFPKRGKFRRYHRGAWMVTDVQEEMGRVQLEHPVKNRTEWAYLGEIGNIDLDEHQVERLNAKYLPTPSPN